MESSDYFWCAKCGVMSLDAWALDSCIPRENDENYPGNHFECPKCWFTLGMGRWGSRGIWRVPSMWVVVGALRSFIF